MKDLRERAIRGGVARILAQAINFIVRFGALVVLARLLDPKDFGLVGMVTAFTGVLLLFRDFGLSSAAIQRRDVTEAQASALFWINLLVGVALAAITVMAAPVLVAFYSEPKLMAVTVASAPAFVLNAASIQHSVALQRDLRFGALAVVHTVALVMANGLAIACAALGFGYWSLVIMMIASPLVTTIGTWIASGWMPGRPQRTEGIGQLARFGGTVTLNGLVYYTSSNFDKVLLGRVWGGEALGLYGRAYQFISIPFDNLNTAAGEVAFSALSRLQHEPARLRSYFLKGYSLLLTLTVPITLACGVFATDVVAVVLGPKWASAAPIFRALAPAMLGFAICNPLGWLLVSLGLVKRSLTMAFVIGGLMIAAFVVGLPYGPTGVGAAYSAIMMLWAVPAVAWAVAGTPVSRRDVFLVISRPVFASVVAAAFALAVVVPYGEAWSPLSRLLVEGVIYGCVSAATLLFVFGQKSLLVDLVRPARNVAASEARLVDQGSAS
jgi:PST family polysaccharide transporter